MNLKGIMLSEEARFKNDNCLISLKTVSRKNISTPMFTVLLCTIVKIWKQPKCPSVDERVNSYGTVTR